MPRVSVGLGTALAMEPYRDSPKKLGRVATTSTPAKNSCPKYCAFWDACFYRQGLHLGRVNRELEYASFGARPTEIARAEAAAIDRLRGDVPLRLHVGGDCRTNRAAEIVAAASGRYILVDGQPVWTYTHAWPVVRRSSWGPIAAMASCESLKQARRAMKLGYAAAIVVEHHPPDGRAWKVGALRVLPCVEQTRGIPCDECRLCFDDVGLLERKTVIAFALHGPPKAVYQAPRLEVPPNP